jgi:hypothetical protein
VFTGDENTPAGRLKLRRPKYRPLKERDVVVRALVRWRERALNQHPHQAVITRRWILPDNAITMLSKLRDTDVHGPETISEVVNGTEEWTSAYAADIHKVITKLDEGKRVRKLCARLSSGAVKKVRSAAWQNRIRKRYEKDAELALITAEDASEEIAKLKKAWRKEKAKLSTRHKTTTGDMEEIKRTTYIHRSKLCQALENVTFYRLFKFTRSDDPFLFPSSTLLPTDRVYLPRLFQTFPSRSKHFRYEYIPPTDPNTSVTSIFRLPIPSVLNVRYPQCSLFHFAH